MAEDIILVAARATRACQAANKKHGHPNRDQDGNGVFVNRKPLNHVFHHQSPETIDSRSATIHLDAAVPLSGSISQAEVPVQQVIFANISQFPLASRRIKDENNAQ
ncbi:MAG: hypothetical protein ABSE51_03795 [Terracidiphilus sp.]